jgi:hypothetical protein
LDLRYQVNFATFFGDVLYIDALDQGTNTDFVYSCSPEQDCIFDRTVAYPSIWPSFAIDGATVYSGAASSTGYTTFGACVLGSSCASGPQPLDLPFAAVRLPGIAAIPDIVLDPQGGAYAFGSYSSSGDGAGLGTTLDAIVHLSSP